MYGDNMRIRSKILPSNLRDWGFFPIMVGGVPFVYIVVISTVLPYFHGPGSFMYKVHFFLSLFVVSNISGNFLGIILCDTSVPQDVMSSESKPNWVFCSKCEKYAPPRSWHCKTCDVCILKRDHHCLFAGYCIGHYNLRYFMLILFYMFFSSLYALVYTSIYVWYNVPFTAVRVMIQVFCPMCPLFVPEAYIGHHVCIYICALTLFAFVMSGVLFLHHSKMVSLGKVTPEKGNKHDLGLRKNIESALGINWYLTWISPLVVSPLPDDGITWTKKDE